VKDGDTNMDIKKLESVVVWKLCPNCSLGMVRETRDKVFVCSHSHCGAVFDFSSLSDTMIAMLLQKEHWKTEAKQE
jgi:ribosomal protein L37AE/L43A